MSSSENINVTIIDITGINLKSLNAYNLALCTDPFDAANLNYLTDVRLNFTNIGIGSDFYSQTQTDIALFRSIPTTMFTKSTDSGNLYINTNMRYLPYPQKKIDTTTITTGFFNGF